MTDTTLEAKVPTEVPATPYSEIAALVKAAGANPAALQFPTDKWGFTSQIKTQVLKAASTVKGSDDKHALLVGTLAVLIAHVKARLESDKNEQKLRLERIAAAQTERAPRERVSGAPVNNVPVVIPEE